MAHDPFGLLRNQRADDIGYFKASGEWVPLHRPTADSFLTHSGSEGGLAWTAKSGDPFTQYLKESDFDDIDFLVGTATGHTAAEIVVGTTPGGELGGTWASPTVDATHSGSAHHAQVHGAADHNTRTRSIDITKFFPSVGTPADGPQGANLRYSAWAFDAAAVEALTTPQFQVPRDYAGDLTIALHWTNLGAGAGDVVWRLIAKVVNDAGDLNVTTSETDTSNTIAAPKREFIARAAKSIAAGSLPLS